MYIIIDTNSINRDYHLSKSGIIKLASKAQNQGYKLCFPEAVVKEMIKHYKEDIEKAIRELKKLAKSIESYTDITILDLHKILILEKEIILYENKLTGRINDLNGKILGPLSESQQSNLMDKAINRKKPIKHSGTGLADAYIWGNIMDIAGEYSEHSGIIQPRIIFVTDNHHDFCNSDGSELHDELKYELDEIDVSPKTIKIVKSLDEASNLLVTHSDNILTEEIKAQFLNPEYVKSSLRVRVETRILLSLPFKILNNEEIGFGDLLEDPTIDMINEDYIFNDIELELVSDDQFSISLKVSVTCLIDVFVEKSEAIHIDDLSIYDYNWNNHYVAAQIEKKIWFNVSFLTDKTFMKIDGFEIEPDEYLNNNFESNKNSIQ